MSVDPGLVRIGKQDVSRREERLVIPPLGSEAQRSELNLQARPGGSDEAIVASGIGLSAVDEPTADWGRLICRDVDHSDGMAIGCIGDLPADEDSGSEVDIYLNYVREHRQDIRVDLRRLVRPPLEVVGLVTEGRLEKVQPVAPAWNNNRPRAVAVGHSPGADRGLGAAPSGRVEGLHVYPNER